MSAAVYPLLPAAVAALAVLLGACGAGATSATETRTPAPAGDRDAEPEPTPEPGPTVVAIVAPLADLVARVGGEHATVHSLVPHGADSHTWEPGPGAARLLTDADLFIANGLDLNQAALQLAEANLPGGAPAVLLGEVAVGEDELIFDHVHNGTPHTHDDGTVHAHDDDGRAGPNPHLWLSPRHAIAYVAHIADALAEAAPHLADTYRQNAADITAELVELDTAIAAAVATIPQPHRKLVTYHDGWSYFARHYGLTQVAAIQPADFSEPSAHDVRHIIDQIRAEGVPAIFGSEVFPSDVLDVIAEETGARYVSDLADDELPGQPGDPEHSYVGMMLRNVRIMVEALGGDPSALDTREPAAP